MLYLALLSFVFILSILLYLPSFILKNRMSEFDRKIFELIEWSKQNPNSLITEPEPSKLIKDLDNLRGKLKGKWPRSVEKPYSVIFLLRFLEAYPNSHWEGTGSALKKLIEGEDAPEGLHDVIVLRTVVG